MLISKHVSAFSHLKEIEQYVCLTVSSLIIVWVVPFATLSIIMNKYHFNNCCRGGCKKSTNIH